MPFDEDDVGHPPAKWIVELLARNELLWRRMRMPNRPMRKKLLLWGLALQPQDDVDDEPLDELDGIYDVL